MATLETLADLCRGKVAYVISSTGILSISRTLSWIMVHNSIWLKRPTNNKSITFSLLGAMALIVRLELASILQSATSLTLKAQRVVPEIDNNSRRKSTSRTMQWRQSQGSVCNPTYVLADRTLRFLRYKIWWRMRVKKTVWNRPR